MPELPEVEVVRRSLDNFTFAVVKIIKVDILNHIKLRYPINQKLKKTLKKAKNYIY